MKDIGLFDKDGKELDISNIISNIPLQKINRIEVIDENGRSYVNWKSNNIIKISLQDDERTLKIFISQVD